MAGLDYPKRSSHFAHRFTRLLVKACVANELGSDAVLLLITVAHTEDAKGYRGPVTFWNGQLFPLIGVGSESALRRVREKCIKSGWLAYTAGAKGKAPSYWVVIPTGFGNWDDAPTDESPTDYGITNRQIPTAGEQESGENPARIRQESGGNPTGKRRESEQHSSLEELVQEDPPTPQNPEGCGSVSFHSHEPPPKILRFTEVLEAWNGIEGITRVEHITPRMRLRFGSRSLSDLFATRWRDGIEAVRRSPRCCEGASGWRATLEWFLDDGSLEELLNGNFEPVVNKAKPREPPPSPPMDAAARERMLNPPNAEPMKFNRTPEPAA